MQNFWNTVWFTLSHVTFKGRTSRKDYLYWFLFNILFSVCVFLLVSLPAKMVQPHIPELSFSGQLTATLYFLGASIVTLIVSMWKFVAEIALYVRRFHDFGKSAWWALLWYWLISFAIVIVLSVTIVIICSSCGIGSKNLVISIAVVSSQILILISLLYYLYLCLFKKGDVGENKYGLPSELNKD